VRQLRGNVESIGEALDRFRGRVTGATATERHEEVMSSQIATLRAIRQQTSELRGFRSELQRTNRILTDHGGIVSSVTGRHRNLGRALRDNRGETFGLSRNIANLIIAFGLLLVQPITTMLLGIAGALTAVASSAIIAAKALAGVGVGIVGQLVPVVGILGTALHRIQSVTKAFDLLQQSQQRAADDTADAAERQRDALDSLASAQEGVVAAADGLRDAQKEQTRAQEGLIAAREEARRQLEELARSEREAQMAAEGAALTQTEARLRLHRALREGGSVEIAQAQLGVGEADISASRLRGAAQRAAGEFSEATKRGIRESDAVLAARERLEAVDRRIAQATRSATSAQRQLEGAMRNVARAAENQNAVQENLRRTLADLSTRERSLVATLDRVQTHFQRVWRPITDIIVGALEGALLRFEKLLDDTRLIGSLESLARALANSIKLVVDALTTPAMRDLWGQLIKEAANNVPLVAQAFANIAESLLRISVAAGPLIRDLLQGFERLTARWRDAAKDGEKLTSFFREAAVHVHGWLNLFAAFFHLIDAIVNAGARTGLNLIERLTNAFERWTKGIRENGPAVQEFFRGAEQVALIFAHTLENIGRAAGELFKPDEVVAFGEFLNSVMIPPLITAARLIGNVVTTVSRFFLANKWANETLQWAAAIALLGKGIELATFLFFGLFNVIKRNPFVSFIALLVLLEDKFKIFTNFYEWIKEQSVIVKAAFVAMAYAMTSALIGVGVAWIALKIKAISSIITTKIATVTAFREMQAAAILALTQIQFAAIRTGNIMVAQAAAAQIANIRAASAVKAAWRAALVATAWGALILAASIAIEQIILHWDRFKLYVSNIIQSIQVLWDNLWKNLLGIVNLGIYAMLLAIRGLVEGLERALGWIPGIGGKIKSALQSVEDWIDGFRERGVSLLRHTGEEMASAWGDELSQMTQDAESYGMEAADAYGKTYHDRLIEWMRTTRAGADQEMAGAGASVDYGRAAIPPGGPGEERATQVRNWLQIPFLRFVATQDQQAVQIVDVTKKVSEFHSGQTRTFITALLKRIEAGEKLSSEERKILQETIGKISLAQAKPEQLDRLERALRKTAETGEVIATIRRGQGANVAEFVPGGPRVFLDTLIKTIKSGYAVGAAERKQITGVLGKTTDVTKLPEIAAHLPTTTLDRLERALRKTADEDSISFSLAMNRARIALDKQAEAAELYWKATLRQANQSTKAAELEKRFPRLSIAPSVDRAGVSTKDVTLAFAERIAEMVNQKLTIGTGTSHSKLVKGSNRVSQHWTGNAVDIPAEGEQLTLLGQTALVAAGMSPARARARKGGVFDVGEYQIIFNTQNHYDHLHVGVRDTATPAGGGAESSQVAVYRALAEKAATVRGIPPELFTALITQESAWDPRVMSKKGAVGLAQIHLPSHPNVTRKQAETPAFALDWGAEYLASLHKKFGRWDLALAAYNLGPNAVGKKVPQAARGYVQNILDLAGPLTTPMTTTPPLSSVSLPTGGGTALSTGGITQTAIGLRGVEELAPKRWSAVLEASIKGNKQAELKALRSVEGFLRRREEAAKGNVELLTELDRALEEVALRITSLTSDSKRTDDTSKTELQQLRAFETTLRQQVKKTTGEERTEYKRALDQVQAQIADLTGTGTSRREPDPSGGLATAKAIKEALEKRMTRLKVPERFEQFLDAPIEEFLSQLERLKPTALNFLGSLTNFFAVAEQRLADFWADLEVMRGELERKARIAGLQIKDIGVAARDILSGRRSIADVLSTLGKTTAKVLEQQSESLIAELRLLENEHNKTARLIEETQQKLTSKGLTQTAKTRLKSELETLTGELGKISDAILTNIDEQAKIASELFQEQITKITRSIDIREQAASLRLSIARIFNLPGTDLAAQASANEARLGILREKARQLLSLPGMGVFLRDFLTAAGLNISALGLAEGGRVDAKPGGTPKLLGEGGYAEYVITTDPAQRSRMKLLVGHMLAEMGDRETTTRLVSAKSSPVQLLGLAEGGRVAAAAPAPKERSRERLDVRSQRVTEKLLDLASRESLRSSEGARLRFVARELTRSSRVGSAWAMERFASKTAVELATVARRQERTGENETALELRKLSSEIRRVSETRQIVQTTGSGLPKLAEGGRVAPHVAAASTSRTERRSSETTRHVRSVAEGLAELVDSGALKTSEASRLRLVSREFLRSATSETVATRPGVLARLARTVGGQLTQLSKRISIGQHRRFADTSEIRKQRRISEQRDEAKRVRKDEFSGRDFLKLEKLSANVSATARELVVLSRQVAKPSGLASGERVSSKPGGIPYLLGEGGYSEYVLSTDPRQRNRTLNLMRRFMIETGQVGQISNIYQTGRRKFEDMFSVPSGASPAIPFVMPSPQEIAKGIAAAVTLPSGGGRGPSAAAAGGASWTPGTPTLDVSTATSVGAPTQEQAESAQNDIVAVLREIAELLRDQKDLQEAANQERIDTVTRAADREISLLSVSQQIAQLTGNTVEQIRLVGQKSETLIKQSQGLSELFSLPGLTEDQTAQLTLALKQIDSQILQNNREIRQLQLDQVNRQSQVDLRSVESDIRLAQINEDQTAQISALNDKMSILISQRDQLRIISGQDLGNELAQETAQQIKDLDVDIVSIVSEIRELGGSGAINKEAERSLRLNSIVFRIAELNQDQVGQITALNEKNTILVKQQTGLRELLESSRTQAERERLSDAIMQLDLDILENSKQLQALQGGQLQTFSSRAWQWFRQAVFTGMGGLLTQFQVPPQAETTQATESTSASALTKSTATSPVMLVVEGINDAMQTVGTSIDKFAETISSNIELISNNQFYLPGRSAVGAPANEMVGDMNLRTDMFIDQRYIPSSSDNTNINENLTLNITSPTEVADPVYLAKRIAFERKTRR